MKHKKIVALYEQATDSIHKGQQDITDTEAEIKSLELLQRRTMASLAVAKAKVKSIHGKICEAQAEINKLNPYISQARSIVRRENRLLNQLNKINELQYRRKKVFKEFNRIQ